MNAQGVFDREAEQGLSHDAVAFLQRQFLECFVLEPGDRLTLVFIADPTLKTDIAAGTKILQFVPRRFGVDRSLSEAEIHQPPATGGMNTTASLAASVRDQSLNSLLTATFSCSRDKVKP